MWGILVPGLRCQWSMGPWGGRPRPSGPIISYWEYGEPPLFFMGLGMGP